LQFLLPSGGGSGQLLFCYGRPLAAADCLHVGFSWDTEHPCASLGAGKMHITPDTLIIFQWGPVSLNATILFTWCVMVLMVVGSWLITRKLSTETHLSRWQNLIEVLVTGISDEIRDISRQDPGKYLSFVGTLFLFIAVSNLLGIVPGYVPPTGSFSTAAALALCVFVAVPLYAISQKGLSYLKEYIEPSIFMLPFNIIGEISRTFALAVRLFGNIMSGTIIAAILLAIAPLIFPVLMQVLGLLIGLIQAYIFAILAMVYIAAATHVQRKEEETGRQSEKGDLSDG
jgi:F-type H+-transporting ATPase subunit a